eukprot:COSAG04_NODE_247_length_18901_cov_4.971014_4_plen_281_part_00
MRPGGAALVLAAGLMVAAGPGADAKGGFGGGFRMRRSSSSTSSTTSSSAASRSRRSSGGSASNPYYRGHPPPSRECVGCYYSGGMYYDRTFLFMYMGMAYSCMGCGSRSDANVDSLGISLPAVSATAAVDFSTVWYNEEVLQSGSPAWTAWAGEMGELVSRMTEGALPAASCLVTEMMALTSEDDSMLHAGVKLTLLLEAEDGPSAADVVDKLTRACANRGAVQGHWALGDLCLTGMRATTVDLTSQLGENPIPPAPQAEEPSGFGMLGDLFLVLIALLL